MLVEPSDNIGGGAPGDGTGSAARARRTRHSQCRHRHQRSRSRAATCIALVRATRITSAIGGKGSRLDPGPLTLEVELLHTSDGTFELEDKQSHLAAMAGDRFDMGPCAVVRHGGLTILLTSHKTPPFDLGQWRSQGIEPTKLSVIVVKAAVAHRRAYDPIATRMLWVDTPGPARATCSRCRSARCDAPSFRSIRETSRLLLPPHV